MVIGNVLRNKRYDTHALVLAVKGDGTRVKLHIYGRDEPVWHPVNWYEIATAGDVQCWKCSGSGLYYLGGGGGNIVLNGVYQGRTGPCFQCSGSGQESDDDRKRCHYYWHRYGKDVMPDDTEHYNHEEISA